MSLRAISSSLIFLVLITVTSASADDGAVWYGDPQYSEGSPWSVQILSSDAAGSRMILECPGFWAQSVIQDGEMRTQVILPEAGMLTAVGMPELPSICRLLAIPDDRQAQVVVNDVEFMSVPCENPYLVPPDEATSPSVGFQGSSAETYPAEWVGVEAPGILKDYRVVPVVFHPIRYDATNGELLMATRLDIEVQTLQPSSVNAKTYHARASEAFTPLYESLIDNLGAFNTATPLVSEGPRGAYLIFIDENFQTNPYLDTLVTWKRQLGYQVTVNPITSDSVTRDQIKNIILDAYYEGDAPLDYVLLIGDVSGSLKIPTYTKAKPGGSGEEDVTDHPYALLEGDDYFPDILIGRMSVTSGGELATALYKTKIYQAEPLLAGSSWLTEALVVAGNYRDVGIAPITPVWTSLWLMDKLYDHGYTQVDTVFYWGPNPLYPGTSQITQSINNGVGLVAYRGWADASGWQYPVFNVTNIDNLTNYDKLPVVVSIVCNTGDFGNSVNPCFGEAWARAGSLSSRKGGVAFYGPSDLHTNTKWNNALYAGFFEGLLEENLYRIGQAVVRSKMELYYGFPENTGFGDYLDFYFHVYNILGDPELSIWTSVPADISVEIPDQIAPGRQLVTATVRKMDGTPLGGAYVAFYKADEVLVGGVTSSNGTLTAEIEPLSEGNVTVTASKQNCLPEQQAIAVQVGDFALGMTSISLSGTGAALAGQDVDLTITLHNYGTNEVTGLVADLSSNDPYVSIFQSVDTVGTVVGGGNADAAFAFGLSSDCPDGHVIEFVLGIFDDASHANELKFPLPAGGFQFMSAGFYVEGGDLAPGGTAQIRLLLQNAGTLVATEPSGILTCSDGAVTIASGQTTFPVLMPGTVGSSLSTCNVDVDLAARTGRQVIFDLEVSTESGFSQTVSFPAQLGEPSSTDPLGPDPYGYFAYDNTDAGYAEAPVYSWIELDPAYGDSGATLHSMGDDVSEAIALPFDFKYYGQWYDSLTICSNGWVSMGTTWMANFRNWNLPSALGPPALIAPFWDDLKEDTTGGNSGIHVFTRHDASLGRLVVEWSRCINRFSYENYSNWKEETFELVLYDLIQHSTSTGDGEILFQYQVVNNIDANDNYATVGIEDGGHVQGLQYTYASDYPTTTAPLDSGRAIKFTTDPPDSFDGDGKGAPGPAGVVRLYTPVPNPANPTALLSFFLPREGHVALDLYDPLGRRVLSLLDGWRSAGEHRVKIGGRQLPSGIYFARLSFEGTSLVQKVLLLK